METRATQTFTHEWYTPANIIEAARRVMGSIDLDPASNAIANETVRAAQYYTKEDDGLQQEWNGTVWMNPPYAQPLIRDFVKRLITAVIEGKVTQACVLVSNATETAWAQTLFSFAQAVCFPRSRIKFLGPQSNVSGSPLQGQMIFYFGPNLAGFVDEFLAFGEVLTQHYADGHRRGQHHRAGNAIQR